MPDEGIPSELDGLLDLSFPSDEGFDLSRELPVLFGLIERLGEGYTVIGALALGVQARPRCTRDFRIVARSLPLEWRREILAFGYSEAGVTRQEHTVCYVKGSIRLTVIEAKRPADFAAIVNSRIHRILGVQMRVTESNYLLWLHLTHRDAIALVEAIELINYGTIDRDQLRETLRQNEPALLTIFHAWLMRAEKEKNSTYSDSVERRLRRLAEKDET